MVANILEFVNALDNKKSKTQTLESAETLATVHTHTHTHTHTGISNEQWNSFTRIFVFLLEEYLLKLKEIKKGKIYYRIE